jgi:UDPglucose 6-dehydrogenase
MKIAVIGAGYVGLVTGTCLAEVGHHVICVDIDPHKIEQLNPGVCPIYESGLEELVQRNLKEKRLSFSLNTGEAIATSEVVFSAVGTPPKENHQADLKYVKAVAQTFAKSLNGYKVFVVKSTVPVGTSEEVVETIRESLEQEKASFRHFDVVANPEFLREGTAVKDFMAPNRIVIGISTDGGDPDRATALMQKVYDPFIRIGSPMMFTDIRSAEIIKYASNAFLATKISFINEIADFCDLAGGDVKAVAKGLGLDQRIGHRFLHAGVGYGGSCFPKDVKALIQTGKSRHYAFKILEAVEAVNHQQRVLLLEKIHKAVGGELSQKTIAVWGLSFKPKTDDIRESPALEIIELLLKNGANVRAFDPVAQSNAQSVMKNPALSFHENAYDASAGADVLVVMTEWDEFRILDFVQLKERMRGRALVDGRNIYERKEVEAQGFTYFCFGR